MYEKKSKQDDARYQAAEQKIRKAFYELLEEKGLQKTTVRMIVERAGINRSTFYLHYQDKYDLLESIEEELSGENGRIEAGDDWVSQPLRTGRFCMPPPCCTMLPGPNPGTRKPAPPGSAPSATPRLPM